MRYFCTLAFLLLLPSCIGAQLAETEGRIVGAMDEHRAATMEAYVEHSEGTITTEELNEELDELREERDQTVSEAWGDLQDHVKAEVQRVQTTAKAAAGGILGGGPLIDLLAAIGTSIAGGAYTTNRLRDQKRKRRGEPVGESKNA
jgi:hypothetical protein